MAMLNNQMVIYHVLKLGTSCVWTNHGESLLWATYPLVNIQKAIENIYSWFTHEKRNVEFPYLC